MKVRRHQFPASRCLAIYLVLAFVTLGSAAPKPSANPLNQELILTYAEEFDGTALDSTIWESQAYEKGINRETARGPQNLEVKNGELRLHVRKETRTFGQHTARWTAGFVYTRQPVEPNTFLEARLKPAQAPGVNNAFWLACIGNPGNACSNRYEIDIVETRQDARAPQPTGRGHLAWHDWKTLGYARNARGERDHVAQGTQVEHSFDQYHVWGLWYGESEFIFYLDGKEVWRGVTHPRYPTQWCTGVGKFDRWFPDQEKRAYGKYGQDDWCYYGGYAGDRMNLVFSDLPWGDPWTPLTDAADGTWMAVDYVRMYRPRNAQLTVPAQYIPLGAAGDSLNTLTPRTTGEWLELGPGAEATVSLREPLSLDTDEPRYFVLSMRKASQGALRLSFDAGQGRTACSIEVDAQSRLLAGFDSIVSSATAFPAAERQSPWVADGQNSLLVIRITPAPGSGKDAISLCAFPSASVPTTEPFFYRNIDDRGNTSLNNQWHLNAKQAVHAILRSVRIRNTGTAPVSVKDLRIGPGYRSVLGSVP